ncbi:MAG: hypothetical protein GXY08_00640 [Ruminococcus sp.]|nr:hypothetical protein [Ruminococcus sp.]
MYNYPDNNGEITMDSYKFVNDLKEVAIEQDLIYQYTANLIDTENIDLDFNRNGSADIYDLLEYQIYFYSKISSPFDSNAAKAVVSISASTWDNCDEYYQKCFFDNESNETLIKYFIYKNGFDPSYVDSWSIYDYLEDLENNLPEGADVESIKYAMSRASHLDVFVANVSKISIDAGFLKVVDKMDKINRMLEPNYMEDLEAACKIFDKRMLNGEVAPPDINFDGVIDMEDYKDIMIYCNDLVAQRDSSGSVLTPEVWNHIDNELDLNSDGVSGDMLDLQIVEFVITKYYENEDVDVNALLKAYNDAHSTDNSNIEAVAEISHIKYLEALNGKPIKRSGDADGDNQMKMNDAVLIMQSISNPDTYELTEWGEFNADVANTGNGITPMDALGIQYRLLEK